MSRTYAKICSKVGVKLRDQFGFIDVFGRIKADELPEQLAGLLHSLEERYRLVTAEKPPTGESPRAGPSAPLRGSD